MSIRLKGLICALASAILFGLSPIFCKYAFENGANPLTATFLRSIIAMPFLLGVLLIRHVPLRLTRVQSRDVLLAGLLGMTGTGMLLSSSYLYVSSGLATTLHFVYPALTALCGAVLFRERLTRASYVALLAVTGGILLFSWNTATVQLLGVALALLSGCTYTFYIVFLSHSSLCDIDTYKLTFYFLAVMAVATGVYGTFTGDLSFQMNVSGWLFCAINALGTALAAALFQLGVRFAGPSTASMASAVEPVTSVVCGALMLGDSVHFSELMGCAAVCVGVLLLIPNKRSSAAEVQSGS